MNTFVFLLTHFFTHKDFLPDPSMVPGTIYTPLQLFVELLFLAIILGGAFWAARHPEWIRPIFKRLLIMLVLLEVSIDLWDSFAGANRGINPGTVLPLYPCSIFMFVLPLVIWGRGLWKQIACGYICTLGLTGALINFIYPIARLADYSCISFPAFHTFFYHGSMLFTALVLMLSGEHRLTQMTSWWTPFLASVPGLLFSIPANFVNFSRIHADYMYFTGQHPLAQATLGQRANTPYFLAGMYAAYLFGPVLFYLLPTLLHRRRTNLACQTKNERFGCWKGADI